MARVLLINPPYDVASYMGPALARVSWRLPPLGLLYVAAMLEKHGAVVRVWDGQVARQSLPVALAAWRPDLVGITATSVVAASAAHAARMVKEWDATVPVLLGGVHPTVCPDETLREAPVDAVVRGEGEWTMVEVMARLAAGQSLAGVAGVSFRDGATVVHNQPRPAEADLDRFPVPARHLLPKGLWRMSPDWGLRRPFEVLFTARGCPYDCIFCANRMAAGGTYRVRSLDAVMDEIALLDKDYGVATLLFADDSFVVRKERTAELCERLIRSGLARRLRWQASTRVDSVDRELLRLFKRAGCTLLSFGVESGVERLLGVLNKRITLEDSRRAVAWAKEAGLTVRVTAMLGIPTETKQESLETISFVKRLKVDQVRFSLATPFPGTTLFQLARQEGQLAGIDWSRLSLMAGYRGGEPAYVPAGRDGEELARLQRRANLECFLTPRVAWSYLRRVRSLGDLAEYSRGLGSLLRASLRGAAGRAEYHE